MGCPKAEWAGEGSINHEIKLLFPDFRLIRCSLEKPVNKRRTSLPLDDALRSIDFYKAQGAYSLNIAVAGAFSLIRFRSVPGSGKNPEKRGSNR